MSEDRAATDFFRRSFGALTGGKQPFPWQRRLFGRLVDGVDLPRRIALPTASGKTSTIAIWVIALAWRAIHRMPLLPRRIVWVVDRRSVVDEATAEAVAIRNRIVDPSQGDNAERREMLTRIRDALAGVSYLGSRGNDVLAVSTLRGAYADNGEWRLDPSRPAIIVGTIDMVGSRLLFTGYGDRAYRRPLHAGLLGCDAWVLLDEAHLSPAFEELLHRVRELRGDSEVAPPWRVTIVSATQRVGSSIDIRLQADDYTDPILGRRINAPKILRIHRLGKKESVAEKAAKLALKLRKKKKRVIIYLRSPADAARAHHLIAEDEWVNAERVLLLTGTIRGYERDKLAQDSAYAKFGVDRDRGPVEESHYLVATSAGEVGTNLDADHIVADLTTIESEIQRDGRLNRLGLEPVSHFDMIVPMDSELADAKNAALRRTLEYLRELPAVDDGYDVSVRALIDNPPPANAFSDTPSTVPLSKIDLDAWSQTSIRDRDWPGRPPVETWLRGVQTDPPETWVVWREDVKWLADKHEVNERTCEVVFEAHELLPHERLQEPLYSVRSKLAALAAARARTHEEDPHLIVLAPDGGVRWRGHLSEWEDRVGRRKDPCSLAYCTVVLPVEVGGLSAAGVFTPGAQHRDELDVADRPETRRARYFITRTDDVWTATRFPGASEPLRADDPTELDKLIVNETGMRLVASVGGDLSDESGPVLWYYAERQPPGLSTAGGAGLDPQPLEEHCSRVRDAAEELAGRLIPALSKALRKSGALHDPGKNRRIWQLAAGNRDRGDPIAKSRGRFDGYVLGGYRHELGSLMDAMRDERVRSDRLWNLVLHLVGAHHGWARPGFRGDALDPDGIRGSRKEVTRVIQRFAELQTEYGWYTLAWIETILKAADCIVSDDLDRK